jgi:hypothetical protein
MDIVKRLSSDMTEMDGKHAHTARTGISRINPANQIARSFLFDCVRELRAPSSHQNKKRAHKIISIDSTTQFFFFCLSSHHFFNTKRIDGLKPTLITALQKKYNYRGCVSTYYYIPPKQETKETLPRHHASRHAFSPPSRLSVYGRYDRLRI